MIKHANVNVNLTIKNVIQIKFGITVIVDVSQKMCEKSYIWNPAKCACENCKFFGSIIDNSVTCDKILERTKSILTKTTPTKIIPTHFSVKR